MIELGPFGCTIDRGTVASLDEIHRDYRVKSVSSSLDKVVVLIEPFRGHGSSASVQQSEPAPAVGAPAPQANGGA
ncbi:MAG: hypothetical protein ABIJ47_03875 [Candidatus Bathyarchaeota archaeon]